MWALPIDCKPTVCIRSRSLSKDAGNSTGWGGVIF
jgi:hypothetical protein